MNLFEILRVDLQEHGISNKKMKYLYDLKTACDKMLKYPEMQDMNAKNLEKYNVQKLRILAQCLGITKPNIITSKTELVHKISTVYQSLEFYKHEQAEQLVLDVPETQEQAEQLVLEVPETQEQKAEQDVKKTKRKRKENPEGYVYVFSNPTHAHYGENVYKIGYSGDPNERAHDFDTANPETSIVLYTYRHKKARQLEQRVHDSLDMFRLYQNREFFKCALPVIKEMINFLGTTM